jgi:hypothetical protein
VERGEVKPLWREQRDEPTHQSSRSDGEGGALLRRTAAIGRHNGTTFELATLGPVITAASNTYVNNVFVAIDSNNRPHLVYAEVNNSTSHAFRVNWAYWP